MDADEADRLIIDYLPLVKVIARSMHCSLPFCVPLDDLIQAGSLGLIQAARRFTPERGFAFKTYATPRIRGAILDHLRGLDWANRPDRQSIKKISAAQENFYARFGRRPDATELAQELKLPLKKLQALLGLACAHPRPIEMFRTIADRAELPDSVIYRRQVQERVRQAVQNLPPVTAQIVRLYYFQGKRMWEIADLIGVNESRISQILRRTRFELAKVLEAA